MIRSYKGKLAEQVFQRQRCPGLSPDVQRRAYRKLAILDAAGALSDLRVPPGNRLEKLSATGKASTVFESTTNGVFASFGAIGIASTLKSSITTRRFENGGQKTTSHSPR